MVTPTPESDFFTVDKLVVGYKLGLKNPNLYVCVPGWIFKLQPTEQGSYSSLATVVYNDDMRTINLRDSEAMFKFRSKHPDRKTGKKKMICYYYFLWEKVEEEEKQGIVSINKNKKKGEND